MLTGAAPAPERAVVLTFDDGRRSLWTVGQPLLERHGMKGIVFLVPGRVGSRPPDVAPAGHEGLLSWEEIDALAAKGLLEFQSHTQRHARVHTAPPVVDFLAPDMQEGYAAMDVPLIAVNGDDLLAPDAPLGTPLLRSEPRTSEAPRFREDPQYREACVRLVAGEGGGAFFAQPLAGAARGGSAHRPDRPHGNARRARGGHPLRGSPRRAARSKSAPPERRAPCYPWHASGPTARRLRARPATARRSAGR